MPKCIILQGIPLSGKSTWADEQKGYRIFSCDDLRQNAYGKNYKFNAAKEEEIWKYFYYMIEETVKLKMDFIIDNTNLRQVYIDNILSRLTPDYKVEIKRFPIPLWKALFRNYIRYFKIGKWIPIKVITSMNSRFKNLK